MRTQELLIICVIAGVLLVVPLVAIVLSIIAIGKTRRLNELTARLNHIEAYLRKVSSAASKVQDEAASPTSSVAAASASRSASGSTAVNEAPSPSSATALPLSRAVSERGPHTEAYESGKSVLHTSVEPDRQAGTTRTGDGSSGWETFIGQKAFGWVAVVLFIFSVAFFLRYAYQNNWIGPVGRVAIGEATGAALVIAGVHYLREGWKRFSSMLMSAGFVVIYLATYSSFGFYQLLPQQHAGIFLTAVILESMVAAVLCRSGVIGMISVIGGLLTPVLMGTDRDTYVAFFTYLAVLNLGVVIAVTLQNWRAVGTVALLGTQFLFWSWYHGNYHPEKFAWALGFQGILFAQYFVQPLVSMRKNSQNAELEELARFIGVAVFAFVAFRALTLEWWSQWIGTAALSFAVLYAIAARLILAWRPHDQRLLLTSLAVATGFIAWAIPVQANARWIAVGWAMMGSALWGFGLRVSSQVLRGMGSVLGIIAAGRVLVFDLPLYVRDPFIPVFNSVALPSLTVSGLILFSVWYADRFLTRLSGEERVGIGVAGLSGITLLWIVLSLECHGWFVSRSMLGGDVELWRWRAQLGLTVFWTVFAILTMLAGFRFERPRVRWFSMVLFAVTVLKLFVIDMANVQQIYRIVAFFILAVVLGLVARTYQRFR